MSTLPTSGRIGPVINMDTEYFWNGTRDHKLLLQQCRSCQRFRHPPGPACPDCQSLDWVAIQASGRGTLYSYTVLHHPQPPGFDGPAIAVVVELEEGVRIVSNVDVEISSLRIGEPLEVFFLEQAEGWTAPQFRRPSAA